MARRQYGEGNISSYTTKAGIRYRARWYEPVGPGSHEQVRRTKAGFLTKKEAAAYIRNRLTDVERGQATPFAPTATVQQFLDEWLESHRAGPSTMSGYRRIARLYVVPHIGSRELRALTPDVLARMYRKLESSGSQGGGPLSPTTVLKAHQLLSVALSDAVELGTIPYNPAHRRSAKPPTPSEVKHHRKPAEVWTRKQLKEFLAWAKETYPEWHIAWLLIAYTGVRRSEAIGLQGGDLYGERIVFRRGVVSVKNKGKPTEYVTKLLKNESTKTVYVPRHVATELKALGRGKDEPIVQNSYGKSPSPDYLTEVWIKHAREFVAARPNTPYIKLHGLRHTHATHLLAAGVSSKAVQLRLGHETHAITMDLYTHVQPDSHEQAVGQLEKYYEEE